MIRHRHITLAILVLASAAATGNGFRLVSQDAFAAARGEAFAATADNPSAIHYNPAGISQLDGRQLRVGAYALYFNPTFMPPSARPFMSFKTHEIEKKDAVAPQLYYTHAIPDTPLTVGLGVYAPYGAGIQWPQDTGFRAVAVEGELTYLRINPVVSLEIRPGLSLAIGAMFDDADLFLDQGLNFRPSPPFSQNYFRFRGEGRAAGYNLGLLWQASEQLSLGATFRSKSRLNFSGETDIVQQGFAQVGEKAEMELVFPYTAVLGISYRPTPDWNIEFNADYSNWSSIDETVIRQAARPRPGIQKDIPVTLAWKDSWILKFGATRYFDGGWHASAGYVFNENSVPSGFYSPLAADLDRHFFTFGMGRKWDRYSLDLAYQYGFAPGRTVSGSQTTSKPGNFAGQTADGKYDFESHGVLLSLGLKF